MDGSAVLTGGTAYVEMIDLDTLRRERSADNAFGLDASQHRESAYQI